MNKSETHPLPDMALETVFVEQLSVLYTGKSHLAASFPRLIKQATFQNLKLALGEDLDDTAKQMTALRTIFHQLGRSAVTEDCLGIDAIIKEAEGQIAFNDLDFYASDMSIIFYMNVIEHLQIGACRILKVITEKPAFEKYAQLIKESLDMNKDNARLFKVIAAEYLGVA